MQVVERLHLTYQKNQSERPSLLLKENQSIRTEYCFSNTVWSRSNNLSLAFAKSEVCIIFQKPESLFEKCLSRNIWISLSYFTKNEKIPIDFFIDEIDVDPYFFHMILDVYIEFFD